jgi:hypothetical protein
MTSQEGNFWPLWKESIATTATLSTEKHNLFFAMPLLLAGNMHALVRHWGSRSRPAALTLTHPGGCDARCSLYREVYSRVDLDSEQQPCDRVESLRVLSAPTLFDPVVPHTPRSLRATPPCMCYFHVSNVAETDRVAQNVDIRKA